MNHFCPKCRNFWEEVTTGSKLQFKCDYCGTIDDARPEDTLLDSSEKAAENTAAKFKHRIKNAPFTSINPRYKKKCPECSEGLVSMVRVGEEQKVIYICPNRHVF